MKSPPAMRETWVGKIPWGRERLPTPVFWPGEFHGLCRPWGCKESYMTERLPLSRHRLPSVHWICTLATSVVLAREALVGWPGWMPVEWAEEWTDDEEVEVIPVSL